MLKYFVILIATTSCQGFGNDVTFLGLLPLYNFFSHNRPAQHPTLSLYESSNPTQFSTTPKISPLVPVYAFLNNFGTSQPELQPMPPRPTYVVPQPMITTEESTPEETSTEPPVTLTPNSTTRPPLPPPPRPPPPPLPPPLTSSIVQNINNSKMNKSKYPLPLPRPSGSGYRPHRPIKHPPRPPPGYRNSQRPYEETPEEEGSDVDDPDIINEDYYSSNDQRTHEYKFSAKQDGEIYYQDIS